MTIARREMVDESVVGIYHCRARCVRRAYLGGHNRTGAISQIFLLLSARSCVRLMFIQGGGGWPWREGVWLLGVAA